MRKLINSMTN